jgi:hypothetical protein
LFNQCLIGAIPRDEQIDIFGGADETQAIDGKTPTTT